MQALKIFAKLIIRGGRNMKNDALNRFKEEMNRRGLIRKIQVCANLIPPPA